MAASATLYLVPNGLDVGTTEADVDIRERLPLGTLRVAAQLGHWVCENAKTTRAFLKRVDAVAPLAKPLQQIAIVELPRPPKGRPAPAPFDASVPITSPSALTTARKSAPWLSNTFIASRTSCCG